MPDKIDQLYDALKADKAVSKSRENFRSFMLAPGTEGYQNRLKLFKALKADGAVQSKTYEEFRSKLVKPSVRKHQASAIIGGASGTSVPEGWGELDTSTAGVAPVMRDKQPQPSEGEQKAKQMVAQTNRALRGDKAAAAKTGLTSANQRMKDEMDYSMATGKELRLGMNLPGVAPTVARDENGEMILGEDGKPLVGLTTDEDRVAQYQQQEREWKLNDVLSKAFKEADKGLEARTIMALEDSENERNENPLMFALSHMSPQSTNVYQQQQEQTLNKGISPEALWGAVNSDNFIEKLLQNEEISKMASSAGMSQEEYAQKVLLPRVAEHYDKYLTEKYDIKGFGEYLINRALGSMTGNILSGGVQTKGQMQMRSAAVERAHEGLGTYKPGIAGRLAGEVAMFAPDAPELMATGVFGEAAASAVGGGISLLGEKLKRQGLVAFGRLASSGSPFLAANVGRATKWGGLAANRALGGTGLGMFMGTSGAIQDMNVGDGSLASIGKAFASGFAEGSVTGALLGVTNLGAQAGASRITGNSFASKASRAGLFGTAFVAENQLFANMDRFKEEDFDWVDSSMDAFYMQLAGKVASGHSMAESMKGVARLFTGKAFSEKPKSGLSWQSDGFRLNDSERAEIERAFGGTELSKIAANPENVGKILGDKQNISWKTRQKVSGSMGMLEPSRPYTESVLIMDKLIDERGENRELIETHAFETEEQKQEILAKIQDRLNDTQMWSDFSVVAKRKNAVPTQAQIENARVEILADMQKRDPKYDASNLEEGGADYQAVIDRANEKNNQANILVETVANDYGKTAKEVYDAMYKEPVERTFEEQSILDDLAARLHETAYPEGEYHPSQSAIDAKKMVGGGPVIDPRVSAELSRRVDTATNEYNQFMQSHQNILEGVTKLGKARPDEVLMFIADNYSGSERDEGMRVVSNYYNALAAKEAAMEKVADNIENYVSTEVDRRGFKGMLDGAPDTENIITLTDGKTNPKTGQPRRLTLLNGDVGTIEDASSGRRVLDSEKSGGQIICRDEDGQFVILKPDAKISFVEQMPKEDYAKNLREELGVQNTQTIIETGLEKPEVAGGSSDKEADGKEPITDSEAAQPAVEAGQEKTGGDEAAGAPAIDGAEPAMEIPTDKDGVKLYEQGVNVDDAIADIRKDGYDPEQYADLAINEAQTELSKMKEPKTRADLVRNNARRKELQNTIEYYNSLKERMAAGSEQVSEGEESINNVVWNNNGQGKTVPLQPKVAKGRTADERRAERIQQLKEQYGDHFNADFSYAETAEELAAMYVGRNRTLDRESLAKELGYKLGLQTGDAWAETLLAKKGEGKSTRQVAHEAWESPENPVVSDDGTRKFDDQEIHDALLALFRSAEKKSDIIDYPINRREEAAKKLFEEEKARENDAKVLGEEPIVLTDEELERINKELPFEKGTGDDIPDAPITQLEKTARELMSEDGTPNIHVINTEMMSKESWRKMLDDEYNEFLSDEEIDQLREERMEEGVYYNPETGKITVFSGKLTPEELRKRVQIIKDYIHDRNSNGKRGDDKDILPAGSEQGLHQEDEGKAPESKPGEGDAEPERKPEPEQRVEGKTEGDDYLKPRNDKEKEIISDVEKKLAKDIAEQQKKVNKAKKKWDDETAKVNQRPEAGLFGDEVEERPKKAGDQLEMFEGEEKPALDVSEENLRKQVKEYEDAYRHEQQELDRLRSESERNSRIRGALDNERRQTEIETEGEPLDNPTEALEKAATEFKKEQDKEIGITHDETPEQKADRENAEKLADTPITSEEIDGASLSDVEKTLAKAYLNGNQGFLQKAAYLKAYDNVRNRRQDGTGDSLDAGSGTQLDSGENQPESGLGRTGGRTVRMAETEGPRVGVGSDEHSQPGMADGERRVRTSSGEGGDNGVSGRAPGLDGLSSGGERRGGRGLHSEPRPELGVGQPGGRSGSNTGTTPAGSDAAIAASKQRLAELRKRFKQAGRNGTTSVSLAGMNSEQIEILMDITTEAANLGYQYLSRGIREFRDWSKQMLDDFHDWLHEDMKWSDREIDEYLNEVWNCEYNIDGVTRTIGEWASFMGEKELRKVVREDLSVKFEKQKAAESVEVKTGDIDNIRETLPYLLPEQQDDVLKAETQFFDESHQDREHGNGKGMMFTNGTGTGKTYTGLGIVKRFVKQGKGRVLILTPSQEKVTDWANDGLNLGLNVEKLDDIAKAKGTTATKSKGTGVVVTTYANARQNLALLEDCFDLIVYDESHKITEGKEAAEGEMYKFHQMLTNKDVEKSIDRQTYWLPEWIEYRNLVKERDENRKRLNNLDNFDNSDTVKIGDEEVNVGELRSRLNARMLDIENRFEELRPIMQEIRESKRGQAEIDSKRTKTVFLSATPFNTRENMKYAEGYLFSYPEEDPNTKGSYNHRSPEDAFLEQYFPAGYRWRYGRLESHVENAEALGRQEIDFSDYLQNQLGTLSGRMISSDYDYSRDFPIMTLDHAGRFNQAMSEVYRNKRYNAMSEAFHKAFDYNYSTALFEAMKTSLVMDRIKAHLKRGQKVVVFHRRRTSGDLEPPFERALNMARVMAEAHGKNGDQKGKQEILNAVKAFSDDFADMLEWEKGLDYTLPRDQIAKVFGEDKIGFYSGAESKNAKHQTIEDFMKDNGGKDIIVIQEASGKEGISLHDKTGEHQRVEINLALPQSPIAFIQIEGRIYRIGQKSNAIFEYPLLGLDLETSLFAQKFNSALGTTENLALGSKARNLRKSIANSILMNTGEVDYDRQGFGGKDMDGQVSSRSRDGFDDAITDYYGNQKMKGGRDNREGYDYFPTPEPVGFKMVEWAQLMEGESALEPSAGHGAIARYVPETNPLTAIEPSAELFSKLQMRAGGPGRRFEDRTFEEYPLANKHDVIVMNPPYGVQGKMAMEHVAKAFKHLNEGGRLIAIIPDGPAMERRFDAWLNSTGADGTNGANVLVGNVKLPDVAFGRAGTNVRTRIVVIDKVTRAQMREGMTDRVEMDLSGAKTVDELFEQLRHVNMPERTIDQAAIAHKQALKTKKSFEDNKFVREVVVDEKGVNISNRSSYGSVPSVRINFDQIDKPRQRENLLVQVDGLIKARDNAENIDYGKWKNKTYGSGKNAVPAVEAIRDYCDTAIKTIANVLKTTPDGLEKEVKAMKEEAERQRQERMTELQHLRDEQERKHQEKVNFIVETALKENSDNDMLTPIGIENNLKIAHGRDYLRAQESKRHLREAGIDWQTGHKIPNKQKNIEKAYREEMPLGLDTMKHLMAIAEDSIDANRKMAAKRALEMSGIHSDTGDAKEGFDYSSHDEYYEKELREFLEKASPIKHLKTKIQEREEGKPSSTVAPKPAGRKESYEYKLDQNTKTGADMHLVVMNERVDDATYKDLQRKAKALNDGYYNRFKKAWHFKTEEDARKFMEQAGALKGTRFSEEPAKKTPKTVFSEELEKKKRKEYFIEAGKGYSKEEFGEVRKRSIGKSVDGENADKILHTMKNTAEEMPAEVEFTDENYEKAFGDGVETPIGHVKMSDNQKTKLADNYRTRQIALAKRTLESPDMIIEKPSYAKEGQKTERPSTYVFVKTFRDKEGKLATYYFSVTVQRDGMEVSMSNYIPEEKQVKRDMREGKLAYIKEVTLPSESGTSEQGDQHTLPAGAVSSESKDRNNSDAIQENGQEIGKINNSGTKFKEGTDVSGLPEHAQKIVHSIEKTAKKLNTPVKIARSIDEVTNKDALKALREGRIIKGWFEEGTGEIVLYLPNIADKYSAMKTVAHEVVGHHGLRELLGEKGYRDYMRTLWLDMKDESLSKYIKENYARHGDIYTTIDEYLAEAAEKGYGKLPMWQKVRDVMTDAMRKAGFEMTPSISDVKYMVWLSKNQLRHGEPMSEMKRQSLLYRLGKEKYDAKVKDGEFVFGDSSSESSQSVPNMPFFPGNRTYFRSTPSAKTAKMQYERALNRMGYVWKESHIDQMQAGVELMRAISGVKKIEDIPSVENFVLAENQMSSKEEQMDYLFNRDYMNPLSDAVASVLPEFGSNTDNALRELQLYMIKKSGLERNRCLYVRDRIREYRKDSGMDQNAVQQLEDEWSQLLDDIRDDIRNGQIDLREYLENMDAFIKQNIDPNFKAAEHDYSGLTAMSGSKKGYDDNAVIDDVMATESMVGDERIKNLWDKTKAVSQYGLDMEYEGGLDSKEKHDKVSKMFEWYVPMRGYDETRAEDVYDYLEENKGTDYVGPVLMNAKGRESMSDVDLFAQLGAMSSDAIHRALKNQVKQTFARFIRNHYGKDGDNRLVTELKYLWGEKRYDSVTGNEYYEEVFPDIPENATADEIAKIVEDFETDMKAKEGSGDAKRMRQNSSLPFRPSPKNKSQHIVEVYINGEKKTFIVNGNPRAAQAINGQLKAETNHKVVSKITRVMAQLNTSYNPDFIVGNTERDYIFSSAAILTKETPKYFAKWQKNYFGRGVGRGVFGVPAMHTNLFRRYREGNLNMSNETDMYFKEFMENGGETGWVEHKNLDKWRNDIRKGVRVQGTAEKAGRFVINAIPDAIEAMNERAENAARFATYMTSRQMGRSIMRSVSDAKEVSVNFNRKGAGMKTKDMHNNGGALKHINAIVAARTAQYGQDYLMFYNAGVQGLNNASKLFRDHPVKTSAAFAGFALGAFLMSQLNQSIIDDEDPKERGGIQNPYAELPEWIRRNRLCLYVGKGEFITVDLPIELRALYGIGDIAAAYTTHPELRSQKPVWQDVMTQITQILPVDFMGEHPGEPWMSFVPSIAMPFAEVAMNQNWYGRKIEKDQYVNENAPRYTRAYKNANQAYIDVSKALNAATNSYSKEELKKMGIKDSDISDLDSRFKGRADGKVTDPAIVEHIVNGYFGGAGQTAGRLAHIFKAMKDGEELGAIVRSNQMPIVRRTHYSPTEQNKMARTRSKWWHYKDEMDNVMNDVKVFREHGVSDPLAKMKQISTEDSVRATRASLMKNAQKQYTKMKKIYDKTENEEMRKDIEMRMDQLMENTVNGLDAIK